MTTTIKPTKTLAFKSVGNTDILLDVYAPNPAPASKRPAILFWHGGTLVTGHRKNVPPWLVPAALKRKWTFISADYRTLPESTGLDLVEDLCDAYKYVTGKLNEHVPNLVDTSKIILAGASGGGYCAAVAAIQYQDSLHPPPAAVYAIYPMADMLAPRWTVKGTDMGLSEAESQAMAEEIKRRRQNKVISLGETLPNERSEIEKHGRWTLLRYMMQSVKVIDYLTGIDRFGASIGSSATGSPDFDAVPANVRKLFPVNFGNVTKKFPPLVVVHGTADEGYPMEESELLATRCREVGVPVYYHAAEGEDHAFDLGYTDVESEEDQDHATKAILRENLRELEQIIGA